MATKVKLRKKPISGGRHSLYLDFYPPIPHPETGEPTRREFLNKYVFDKPKTIPDKEHNKETELLAQQIRQRREMELSKDEIYTTLEKKALALHKAEEERGQRDFMAYYRELADKRKGSNNDNWMCALHYLEAFTGGSLRFADVTEKWCNDFKEYLCKAKSINRKTRLSINTTVGYFNKLKAALKQAYKDGLLSTDINSRIECIKAEEGQRKFLTKEELQSLANTECPDPLLKRAALFSALTGLRHCDIIKLVWEEVGLRAGTVYHIQFRQQKTNGAEVLPISESAYKLLGERGAPDEKPFEGLKYSAYQNQNFAQWIGAAGITRHVRFHGMRHTCATLLLSGGVSIETVSKMLGHRDIKTTQIYAKIVDEKKREASDLIKLEIQL